MKSAENRSTAPVAGRVRYLYLVRHGDVQFADGVRRCIGRTDLPLSERGRKKAADAGAYFAARYPRAGSPTVYASPLVRAQETAELICVELNRVWGGERDAGSVEKRCLEYLFKQGSESQMQTGRDAAPGADGVRSTLEFQTETDLQELFLGEWENLPMEELKCFKTLESEPAGGEPRAEGLARFQETVCRILSETEGDVICVTHAGIASLFLAKLLEIPQETARSLPQPYGGISRIAVSAAGVMAVEKLGRMPSDAPSDEECRLLWEHYGTLPKVREHCLAVCAEAERIAVGLAAAGVSLNVRLIRGAALLHDIARNREHEPGHDRTAHAAAGADMLEREGYPRVADIIRCHHDLGAVPGPVDERKVVYLADKRIRGTQRITLEERFAASLERCRNSEDPQAALAARARRLREAELVERQIRVYFPEV